MDLTKTAAPANPAEPDAEPARADRLADAAGPAGPAGAGEAAEELEGTKGTGGTVGAEALDGTEAPEGADSADRPNGADRANGADGADDLGPDLDLVEEERPTGVRSAASAVVAAGLGLVALSGTWVSRVLAERQTLIGQIESVTATSTEAKIEALYGNAWHLTALVNGIFSALALLLAVLVLLRPAFGEPGRVHPTWVRAVAWAAVALGALGVLVFGLMYLDVLTPLPTAA
ncbi:hypothetical protein [Streptomyces bambusae]|uniref:Integral membrane protein n=1 Tax=Streptomyces bambusae TaxID=1550616 RepID=A0ABS6ZBU9_9ACTN|nr:hypothetical protein [Streptomyces bambusae]MBW5485201.1 hypothetical protein [Streptomyces bambusae]